MKKLIFGAMSFGLLLTACSSETLLDQTEEARRDVDRTYYVKVNIHGDSDAFTRAAATDGNPISDIDFENGTDDGTYDESKVTTVYFVFYDKDGNVVGNLVQGNLSWKNEEITGQTVEKYGEAIVQVDVPKTSEDPAKVICYINPIAPQSLQFDLASIQTVTRGAVYRSEYGFAMSNSVYYPNVEGSAYPATNADPVIAVDLQDGDLKTTYKDAEDDEDPLNIYVERYAAKINFAIADDAQTDYETTAPTVGYDGVVNTTNVPTVKLHFVANRWVLNAESNETYMIKSFRGQADDGQLLANNYTYGDLNKIISSTISRDKDNNTKVNYENGSPSYSKGQWQWNNASYHRSYWGMSPAYYTADYPVVADDLEGKTLLQKYYSFNELTGTNAKGNALTDKVYYAKETTVGSIALTSENPKAAVASVVFTGQYNVTVGDQDLGNLTFYTYGQSPTGQDLVFFEAKPNTENGESVVEGTQSMLRRLVNATSILYVKDEAGNYITARGDDVCKYAYIGKHEHTDGTEAKISSRLRTLVLSSEAITNRSELYLYAGNTYKSIVEEVTDPNTQVSLEEANENIYQQVGTCAKYDQGMAYFNIPVMHYGWYRENNKDNKERYEADGINGIEWSKVQVGDFGVVRNHSYNINVSEIKGLGTAIADGEDPIVPPADTESYFAKYRINILKWAVVPTQNVKL